MATRTAVRRVRRWLRTDRPLSAKAVEHGQSLTELALILPVLLLLVVAALDFGRIYLGYINVQNMARIAANEAANNPLAWSVNVDTAIQTRYRNQILQDTTASNCLLPQTSGGDPIVPPPSFTDMNGDGTSVGLGDRVTVQLTCTFTVATPLIGSILGNQIKVTAESDFPVKAGMTAVLPSGEGGGGGGGGLAAPPVAGFVANSLEFATSDEDGELTVSGPDVAVDFRDASGGGAPTEWTWTVSDGGSHLTQDMVHTFHCPVPDPVTNRCEFWVRLVAGNPFGASAAATMYVHVLGPSAIDFTADRQVIDRNQTVTFTNLSDPGGTNFAWTFGDGQTASGPNGVVTHTYSTLGVFTVTLTVTYPVPPPGGSSTTRVNYITVNPGYCTVPNLINVRFDSADESWLAAGFTGQVQRGIGANPGNFLVQYQSLTAGVSALCTNGIYVSNVNPVGTPAPTPTATPVPTPTPAPTPTPKPTPAPTATPKHNPTPTPSGLIQ